MNIHEAMEHLKTGQHITRKGWFGAWYVKLGDKFGELDFYIQGIDKIVDDCNMWFIEDLEADDWEVVE